MTISEARVINAASKIAVSQTQNVRKIMQEYKNEVSFDKIGSALIIEFERMIDRVRAVESGNESEEYLFEKFKPNKLYKEYVGDDEEC